nr:DNA polymerase IV [Maliibacterium massiliense]
MGERIILHCDLNSFYASVELLSRPDLRGKPVAVGGSSAARHGIILAKNPIAQSFGVRTAETLWQARRKCPELIILPPHFDLYLQHSRAVRDIYCSYTDQVEAFGLDECWLDVTGSQHLFGTGAQIAEALRARVARETGLTISVGVSFNKTMAKLGSDLKKPDAVTCIPRATFRDIVWPLPIGALLFAGRATTRTLSRIGVTSVGQLARMQAQDVRQLLGKNGLLLHQYANGIDPSPVHAQDYVEPAKGMGHNMTLPYDITSTVEARRIFYVLADAVALRLHTNGMLAHTVVIWIRYADLSSVTRQVTLHAPSDLSFDLADCACALFERHWTGRPVRALGIHTANLHAQREPRQLCMLDIDKHARAEALERSIQAIRGRFGYHALQRAALLDQRDISRDLAGKFDKEPFANMSKGR